MSYFYYHAECGNAEFRYDENLVFILVLNVAVLTVILLNVIMQSVFVKPSVIMLNIIMLNVPVLSYLLVIVAVGSVILLNVIG
jgi:hypothetical protein